MDCSITEMAHLFSCLFWPLAVDASERDQSHTVFSSFTVLRKDRGAMVETLAEYQFLHKVIALYLEQDQRKKKQPSSPHPDPSKQPPRQRSDAPTPIKQPPTAPASKEAGRTRAQARTGNGSSAPAERQSRNSPPGRDGRSRAPPAYQQAPRYGRNSIDSQESSFSHVARRVGAGVQKGERAPVSAQPSQEVIRSVSRYNTKELGAAPPLLPQ